MKPYMNYRQLAIDKARYKAWYLSNQAKSVLM